jgi:uncharacterized coiled-coil DUF342 family protein
MSKERTSMSHAPGNSFKDLQIQIEEFREKRDELNKKTKTFINQLQEIDIEIENLLKVSRENYKKKRDYWNDKVKQLKQKKNEYKKILDSCIEDKKKLQKENKQKKDAKPFISIKQIERKIDNLERRIETENLDISEENLIVDKIRELAEAKQEFLAEQKNTEYFKIERKIQIVKINLNKIYEQLTKWSNKSQNYHSKLQEIYDKVNNLKEKKKRVEEELIENKKAADAYHEQFLKVMNQRKHVSKKKKPYKSEKRGKRPYTYDKKRNDELEKLKEDKLAAALEKQKAGKKLNLYEARLILEKSKG